MYEPKSSSCMYSDCSADRPARISSIARSPTLASFRALAENPEEFSFRLASSNSLKGWTCVYMYVCMYTCILTYIEICMFKCMYV